MVTFQSIKDFCSSLFTNWLFTEKGTAVVTLVWGATMTALAVFTDALSKNAPLSYGVALTFGLWAGLHLCRTFNGIFIRRKTRKPTFIEYEYVDGIIEILSKSNIHKVPHSLQMTISIVGSPSADAPPVVAPEATALPAARERQQTFSPSVTAMGPPMFVTFEKPVFASHITIERISGTKQRTHMSVLEDGFSLFSLENLESPSRFKVVFQ